MKLKFIIGIVLFLMLILSLNVIALEGDPGDYSEMNEQEKINYLQNNYGVTISGAGLSNVIVSGDSVSISDGSFEFQDGTFSGGSVEIRGDKIVSATDVLINDYTHNGAFVAGTVTIGSGFIHLDEGRLNLGSNTDSKMEITTSDGTEIDVSGGSGYNGNIIANDGKFDLKLHDNSDNKEQRLNVEGKIELVNGRIKNGDGLEALTPVEGAFSEMPKEGGVSFTNAEINGDEIKTNKGCIAGNCFDGDVPLEPGKEDKKDQTVKINYKKNDAGDNEVVVKGEKVKHREANQNGALELKRIISSESGVTINEEAGFLTLGEDSTVTEIRGGDPHSTTRVSEQTTYLPDFERNACDLIAGSCVAIDNYGSARVRATDNNNIRFNAHQTVPSLVVDKINDGSKVRFVEQGKNQQLTELNFNKEAGLTIYPAGNLNKLNTKIVYDYALSNEESRAIEIDPYGKKVEINGKPIAYLDGKVIENYYLTNFGKVITQEEKESYTQRLKQLESYDPKNNELNDFLILALKKYGYLTDEKLEDFTYKYNTNMVESNPRMVDMEIISKNLLSDKNIVYGYQSEENLVLISNSLENPLASNPILQLKLIESYEGGELSSGGIGVFNENLGELVDLNSADEVEKYINLLKKAPNDVDEAEKIAIMSSQLGQLILINQPKVSLMDISNSLIDKKDLSKYKYPDFVKNPYVTAMELYQLKKSSLGRSHYGNSLYNERESFQARLDIIQNAPELSNLLRSYAENAGGEELKFMFEQGKENEAFAIFEEWGKNIHNPKLSEKTREILERGFKTSVVSQFATQTNHLGHIGQSQKRVELIGKAPTSVLISSLTPNMDLIGNAQYLYRSSEGIMIKELEQRAKQEGKSLLSYVKENSNKNTYDAVRRTMIACGQVTDSNQEMQNELDQFLLKEMFLEPSGEIYGQGAIRDRIDTSEGFRDEYITEMERINNWDGKTDLNNDGRIDEEDKKFQRGKIAYMQANLRRNEDKFDQNNPLVRETINNPLPEVIEAESRLKLPEDWTNNWEKEGNKLVRKTAVAFTSNTEDKNEYQWFKKFPSQMGMKIVPGSEILDDEGNLAAYTLESTGYQYIPGKGKVAVIERLEVYGDNDPKFDEKIGEVWRNRDKYAVVSQRGHSGGETEVYNDLVPNDAPKGHANINIAGACYAQSGVARATAEKHPNSVSTGTTGTGEGSKNIAYLKNTLKGLGETNDLGTIGENARKNLGGSENAQLYSGYEESVNAGFLIGTRRLSLEDREQITPSNIETVPTTLETEEETTIPAINVNTEPVEVSSPGTTEENIEPEQNIVPDYIEDVEEEQPTIQPNPFD